MTIINVRNVLVKFNDFDETVRNLRFVYPVEILMRMINNYFANRKTPT